MQPELKTAHTLSIIALALAIYSFVASYNAHFWISVLDYWLIWTCIAAVIGAIVCGIFALLAYLDVINRRA
jgi:hypothetical protein